MKQNRLLQAMFAHDRGDPKRIQHMLKVYQFAKLIGEEEGLGAGEQLTLETAAIVHDIGIRPAEERYGSCSGKLQEQEGPPEAQRLLTELGYDEDVVQRVSWLVGHHHTYTDVKGKDYQILLEADFLVNLFEDGCGRETIRHTYRSIFRTEAGKRIFRIMFGEPDRIEE